VHADRVRVNLTATFIQDLTVTAKCFETAQGLADDQAEREVQEAMRVQQMTPWKKKTGWMTNTSSGKRRRATWRTVPNDHHRQIQA